MSTQKSISKGEPFDTRIALATSLHSQQGIYALLLGSGVSTGAGISTAWEIANDLARMAAAANGDEVATDFDPIAWWVKHGDAKNFGYSGILESLATTSAARRALLAGFFEPSDEERAKGKKMPSVAHHAIASLISRGTIRVILTTNFDRLLEQALEARGIFPQVISSPNGIRGMQPLAHAQCTIIKLHGDYSSQIQLNTVTELASYPREINSLLDRIFDEYGLIVNGWSAEWDQALVTAFERMKSRRYPLFWTSYKEPGAIAKNLIGQHRAHLITNAEADKFFPELLNQLEALDRLGAPKISTAMALAKLKNLLADPTKHIQVREMLEAEVEQIRNALSSRPQVAPVLDDQSLQDAHNEIRQLADNLLQLVATGVYLDRDRLHDDLWLWVVTSLMRMKRTPNGQSTQWWMNLEHFPALLVLRTALFAALVTKRDDLFVRLLREPSWRNPFENQQLSVAFELLNNGNVLEPQLLLKFPVWKGAKYYYPESVYLRATLKEILLPFVGDEKWYSEISDNLEYRIALAQCVFPDKCVPYLSAPGEFELRIERTGLAGFPPENDFRANASHDVWGWKPVVEGAPDPFSEKMAALSEHLRKTVRRW